MKKMIVLISFLCGAHFMSAQQSNQQQRPPERWKPESTEWYYPVPPKVKLFLCGNLREKMEVPLNGS